MVPSNFTPLEIVKIIKSISRDELEELFIKYAESFEDIDNEQLERLEDAESELADAEEQLDAHKDVIRDIIYLCTSFDQQTYSAESLAKEIIKIHNESFI
ncbi:MAG: hypothetical protein WC679_01610 [Bacteroidales bacterium]|jgi:predicted site-specific integrase-resolvase